MSLSQTPVYMVTMHHGALFTSKVSDDCKHKASERLVAMTQFTGTRCQSAVSYIFSKRAKYRLIPTKDASDLKYNLPANAIIIAMKCFVPKLDIAHLRKQPYDVHQHKLHNTCSN